MQIFSGWTLKGYFQMGKDNGGCMMGYRILPSSLPLHKYILSSLYCLSCISWVGPSLCFFFRLFVHVFL